MIRNRTYPAMHSSRVHGAGSSGPTEQTAAASTRILLLIAVLLDILPPLPFRLVLVPTETINLWRCKGAEDSIKKLMR